MRLLRPQINRLKLTPLKQNSISVFDRGTPGVGLIAAFGTTTRADQITNTAAVVQLVICQVDMHKSSFLPTHIAHHVKRIVLDV